jgi:hypothetical protein
MAVIVVKRSDVLGKKWQINIPRHWGTQIIYCGNTRSPDYTDHKNLSLAVCYHRAHYQDEDWSPAANGQENFWTRWLLWNKPTVREAIVDMTDKFGFKFHLID